MPIKKGTHVSPKTEFKKGRGVPQEIRNKLRLTHRGTKLSKEHRRKISEGLQRSKQALGYRNSPETRRKLSISKKGEKSSWWKGGLTSLQIKIRSCFEYRQWRSDVFTRDNFTCQHCNQRGYEIQADHIKPLGVILRENNIKTFEQALLCEELWNINNGRTLCIGCHKKTDSYALNFKYQEAK